MMVELDPFQNVDTSTYADGTPISQLDQQAVGDPTGGYFLYDGQDDIDALVEEIMASLDDSGEKYNRVHMAHSGRFGTSPGGPTEIGGLLASVAATGGFSYRPGEKAPKAGMVLSIHPEASKVIAVKDLKAKDIKTYIEKNKALLKDKNNYIGAWHDIESGNVFLDVSTIVPDHKTATALSIKYGQRAYYDLSTGTEVTVMSGNDPRAHQAASAPGPQDTKAVTKVNLHTLTSDATDAELEALVAAIKQRQADHDAAHA